MKLNGVPMTVQEFIDIDDACNHRLKELMENASPVFMTLCHWIALRRDDPQLTWDDYKALPMDFEAMGSMVEVEEDTPTNGNGLGQRPVSVTSGG